MSERRNSICLYCKCMRECLKLPSGWVCPECLTARLAAAEAAARILLDELSQFTRVEWLLERWPWLKDEAEKMGGCDE